VIFVLFFSSIAAAQDAPLDSFEDTSIEGGGIEAVETGAETGTGTDTETGTETGTGTDTETGTDTGTETETDTETGTASDADAAYELAIHPGADAIVAYDFRLTDTADGSEWYHEFELHRVHAWIGATYGPLEGRVVLETVQSTSDGALIGVAGDSILARFREASLRVAPFEWLSIGAGLLPTLVTPALEQASSLRALGPTALERYSLLAPADLGASATIVLPGGYGTAGAAMYNGEGYTSRELNRGKNTELAAHVFPFAWNDALAKLGVLVAYRQGSSGAGSAQDDRLVAGLTWESDLVRAHAAFAYAFGVESDGARDGMLLEGAVRVEPLEWLLFAARASHFVRDVDADGNSISALSLAAGVRPLEPFDVWLSGERVFAGETAASALPGVERWDIRAIAHARFEY
jgi:hypothetical protein